MRNALSALMCTQLHTSQIIRKTCSGRETMHGQQKLWTCAALDLNSPLHPLIVLLATTGTLMNIVTAFALFHLTSRKPTGLVILAIQTVLSCLFCLLELVDIVAAPQNWQILESHQEGISAQACLLWYSHFPHYVIGRLNFLNITLLTMDRALEITRKLSLRFTMEDSRIRDYYSLITILATTFSLPRLLTVNIARSGVCRCTALSTRTTVLMFIYAEIYLWSAFAVLICTTVVCLCCGNGSVEQKSRRLDASRRLDKHVAPWWLRGTAWA